MTTPSTKKGERITTCRHGQKVLRVSVVERNPATGRERTGLIEYGCVECLQQMKPMPNITSATTTGGE